MTPKASSKSTKSAKNDGLQVTAQQSRYHTDMLALEAPTTKEILIKDLSITLGDKEILARTELFLKENGKYVLVGRNGVGKSTLLKAIAEGHIPGIPWGLRILLLGQTRELTLEEKVGGLAVQDETVLRHVLRSDTVKERYLQEASTLSSGLESQNDSTAAVKSYRQVKFERIDFRLNEARVIAERRSGARGLKARQELNAVEEEHAKCRANLNEDLSTISPLAMSEEIKHAADMLSEVQSTLDSMDAAAAEAKARIVLLGLGFPVENIDDSMSKLSGGWKTRCDLACALVQSPDIILLDEPTSKLVG
jgi:ATP-binding cassette subfamily F protein 3